MLFNSDVFLLIFLPILLGTYYLIPASTGPRARMALLTFASFVFYGWWDLRFLPLLMISILCNHLLAGRVEIARGRLWLTVGVVFNLALIAWFKYANFFLDTLAPIAGSIRFDIILPLGISFFTFQQIAYLIEIYRRTTTRGSLLDHAMFVSFFPQLIAGPIVHYRTIVPQFSALTERRRDIWQNLAIGLAIFLTGLGKKLLIADHFAEHADLIFATAEAAGTLSIADAWSGALAYTMQIYFDFSGYSDMAIGLGRMFGLHLPINFNSPYKAASIIDFWRRWHITLSHFLRDYLYIPLGGGRVNAWRRYGNLMIVMLLGGLWHGAAWTFVIWGGLHGLYLLVNHFWRGSGWMMPRPLGWLITLIAVVLAWIFFRAETFTGAIHLLVAAFAGDSLSLAMEGEVVVSLIIGLILVRFLPNTAQIFAQSLTRSSLDEAHVELLSKGTRWRFSASPTLATAYGLLLLILVMNLWKSSAFIYFQF